MLKGIWGLTYLKVVSCFKDISGLSGSVSVCVLATLDQLVDHALYSRDEKVYEYAY